MSKQSKAAAKGNTLAKLAAVPELSPEMHRLIVADHNAFIGAEKAGQTMYSTFAALLLKLPLNDSVQVNMVCQDMFATYGDAGKDAAQIRVNLINNARKVEFGRAATKDKPAVKGRGRAVLVSTVHSVTSIRELRTALTEAKPEGLKDARGGSNKKAEVKPDAKASKANIVELPSKKADAFQAACQVLEFCEKFLSPGADATLLGVLGGAVKALRDAEIAERMPKQKAA